MKRKKRRLFILIMAIVVVVGGFYINGKYQEHKQRKMQLQAQKANQLLLNNEKVKLMKDVVYGHSASNSRMDIILPSNIKKGEKLPVIFWTHGGGFIAGDKRYKNPYLAQIAEQGFVIVNVNYALAPDSQYPTPIQQLDQATRFTLKNKNKYNIDDKQIVYGGDSAGAQIASQYVALQTNPKLQQQMKMKQTIKQKNLKAAILFGGLYNMQTVRSTQFPRIDLFMTSYTGSEHWEKNFAQINQLSTVEQVTKKYPPTFLTVGDADPFDPQNREFNQVLNEYGVDTTTSFFDGTHNLRHQYQFHMNLKESKKTYNSVMMFLGANTKQSPYENNTKQESESVIKKDK
ncbi:alpha/beta hydrolase [Mammaliicoccus stepanovicii]|uniref:Putative esterase n=1 Tax=Mammaliicoccus stepanovicii TaxID=643214 RepID=A0A239YFF4_9STAP|nr:alpha/beta hydrolase [Mammaliicoccus stepanovicii]PNZ75712.1 lipase [Mammaliicoccus stepanovicii]GGI40755.1 lipase LipA [Mammaliicoccus stepanovicii]SNV57981.1 putative esterase [Mammaliicoccus stepanovicii]